MSRPFVLAWHQFEEKPWVLPITSGLFVAVAWVVQRAKSSGHLPLLGLVVGFLCCARFLWYFSRRGHTPTKSVSVKDLYIYPVKGCCGIRVESAELCSHGLKNDRIFCISRGNVMQTQREVKNLARIRTTLDKTHLTLETDEYSPLRVPLVPDLSAPRVTVLHLKRVDCYGIDVGDEASDWLAAALTNMGTPRCPTPRSEGEATPVAGTPRTAEEEPFRLIWVDPTRPRLLSDDEKYVDVLPVTELPIGLKDNSPLHVISEASMRALNKQIPRSERQVHHANFRPSVVVDGKGLREFEEDFWGEMTWLRGAMAPVKAITSRAVAKLTFIAPKQRCMVTTILQDGSGVMSPTFEPLKTLRAFRQAEDVDLFEGAPLFGVAVGPHPDTLYDLEASPVLLQVGDTIEIHSFSTTPVVSKIQPGRSRPGSRSSSRPGSRSSSRPGSRSSSRPGSRSSSRPGSRSSSRPSSRGSSPDRSSAVKLKLALSKLAMDKLDADKLSKVAVDKLTL